METTDFATEIGFWYHSMDVRGLLPQDWQQDILEVAKNHSVAKTIVPTSVTSREHSKDISIPVMTVGGGKIRQELPWLYDLYQNTFLRVAQSISSERVLTASQDRYAINLNVQKGNSMRYECHVDSNPIEGLLYVTDHPPGSGGSLVVASTTTANSVEEVDKTAIRIFPKAGTLLFFDARKHAHYVDSLKSENDMRVVVAMNYYTPSCSEADRPEDLDLHLGLRKK